MSLRKRLLLALVGSGCVIVAAVALARELIVRHAAEASLRDALEARIDAVGRERCEEGLVWPFGRPPRFRGGRRFGYDGEPRFERDGEGRPVRGGPGPPDRDGDGRPDRDGGPDRDGERAFDREGGRGFDRDGEPRPRGGPPGRGGRPRRRPVEVFFFGRDFSPRIEDSPPFPPPARAALERGETFVVVPRREGPEGGTIGVLATGWPSELCAYAAAFLPTPPPPVSIPAFFGLSLLFLGALAGALYVAAGSPVRRIRALAEGVGAASARRYETGVAVEGRDEIARLATAFNDAGAVVRSRMEDLEKRERTLRDFVANTTHDVSLPLSVLAGHLTEMRERVAGGGPVDAALVAAAARETQYIGSLLHNLGAVSRLETEDVLLERHPVDLRALVERVALRHAGPARDLGVELNHAEPSEPVVATGDVTLIEQALNNLVLNAIRYNHAGGHVAIVLDNDPEHFELRVVDDGPGVTDEELQRLGEPRFRGGDARSRRPEGSGLGLSIVKDVAQRHGFTLALSRPSAGGFQAVLSGPMEPAVDG